MTATQPVQIMAQTQIEPPMHSNSKLDNKPLLRHNEDVRCLVSTALFFTVFLITWHNFTSPTAGGWISFSLWLALFQLSFMGAVTTHNAIHLPVFWSKNWNKFYQVCLSLQYGGAVSIFIPGHNLSHHKYPQQARDVSECFIKNREPFALETLTILNSAHHQGSIQLESPEWFAVLLACCPLRKQG